MNAPINRRPGCAVMTRRLWCLLWCLLGCASACGADAGKPAAAVAFDSAAFGSSVKVAVGLVVVLGAIGASAWLARRVFRTGAASNDRIKILSGLALGAREKLVLVQVDDAQLLLGVAPGRIQTLHVLGPPPDALAGASPGGTFSRQLRAAMGVGAPSGEG